MPFFALFIIFRLKMTNLAMPNSFIAFEYLYLEKLISIILVMYLLQNLVISDLSPLPLIHI